MRTILVCLMVALLSICTCKAISDSLIVQVSGGLVKGAYHKGSVHFLGIPYGTAQRFQFPSPSVPRWTGVLNGSHPGPQCPQHCPPVIRDLHCLPDNQVSESCLTLNIFRPAYNLPSGQAFPVIVFIHGGGFESGSGAAPLYNADYLAKVGRVIVVTINYRLGAFGFLPIFNSYDDVIGNFGLRDQQVALQWVKQNMAAFDGDPNKVTLMGAEAGCQSVALHLTTYTSAALFHSAILHSCPFTIPFRSKNESRQMAKDFAAALSCHESDVSCLRGKSAREILQAQDKVSDEINSRSPSLRKFQVWGPIVDKRNVHDASLLDALAIANLRPNWVKSKPVMMGFVSEEGRTSVYRNFPLPVSNNYFQRLVEAELPDTWQQVTETPGTPYHSADSADARAEMVRFLNYFVYICPARRVAGQLAENFRSQGGRQNVWLYNFDPKVTWSPGGSAWPPGGEWYCRNEACQDLDLLYLFNPEAIPKSRRLLTQRLSRTMAYYWSNFAKYHNPNGLQHSPESSQAAAKAPGSLARNRGFGPTLQTGSAGYPLTTPNIHLSSSLLRLMQGARSPAGRLATGTPAATSAYSPAAQLRVGASHYHQPVSVGSILAAMFPQLRRARVASAARSSSGVVNWPTHLVLDTHTTSSGNVTLVLTQPTPVVRQSLFANVCQFWDRIGYD